MLVHVALLSCVEISAETPHPLHRCFFFFNDTATTEIYTLSLHDALPIYSMRVGMTKHERHTRASSRGVGPGIASPVSRSEEHTSELQSHLNLVCRLLLEKKKLHLRTGRSHAHRRRVGRATATVLLNLRQW